MRQWLYRNGDQCLWNTGGWIKCKEDVISQAASVDAKSTVTQNLNLAGNKIIISGSMIANIVYSRGQCYRGGGLVNANIGTLKPLSISISKYSSLKITDENNLDYNLRVGAQNDNSSTTSSATVLQRGNVKNAEIVLGDYKPYVVIGKTLDYPARTTVEDPGNLNVSFSADITEIYLV